MKITPEEAKLLVAFAQFVGQSLGLPARTRRETMLYLAHKFIGHFDKRPELARQELRHG